MAIQLQAFAERVLFGTSLEEKLSFPREEIVDTMPGSAVKTPQRLPRPAHLLLREDGERVAPPRNAKLIDEKERGRLLHFFGNHELLATELMALAILKFPDAPASFRRGLLETLKDEQIHTKLYIHRMKQCGVEFGDLPLSDYFWKSVSTMEDPLDYVTRLSLTFEQANLDYSREYGKLFDTVGDASTASILDKIYHDEIGHVGFGLKWFRRWKAEGKTDWEAFRERLVFPLSPARAKGNHFNTQGRSEAGFDKAFISGLQIYQQSRGRTPSVFWFNPEAEAFAARNACPDGDIASSVLQRDLGFLPAFLARRDDLLVLENRPSLEFLKEIQSYGFPLPESLTASTDGESLAAPDISRKIGAIRPWAWTPDSVSFFSKTFESLTRKVNVDTLWNARLRELYSKSWSAGWGRQLARQFAAEDWTAPAEVYGRVAMNLSELSQLREHVASLGYRNILCKANFGTSAHGNRCIMANEEITPQIEGWLDEIWKKQGKVVVEPWLDRIFDFSVQFEQRSEGLKLLAFTRLVNNARGQFKGILTQDFCEGIDLEIIRFLMQRIKGKPRIYGWYEKTVGPCLEAALSELRIEGPLGVDAFVYRDATGCLKLKSVVEINPRFTMGRIAYECGQHVTASSVGCFQILTRSQIRKRGFTGISDFVDGMKKTNPVVMTTESKPRIVSGSFPLNDPDLARQFLAVFHVRRTMGELPLVK